MDFASLMSAQISKAKSSTPFDAKSKYVKRSEIEAQREAAYAAEQARLQTEREERAAQKRKLDEDGSEQNRAREEKKRRLAEESRARREEEDARNERLRRKRLGLAELPDLKQQVEAGEKVGHQADDETDIPDTELISRLRAFDEPATLFAESHRSRLRRYRKLTQPSTTTASTSSLTTKGPIPTTLQPVSELEMQLPKPSTQKPPAPHSPERHLLFRQLTSYITLLLTEWSHSLSPQSTTTTTTTKQAYTQTVSNLTPLIRKLESDNLPDTLLTPLIAILSDCQRRRYVSANDRYLRLSIGKAAWPIGVTMVGIHERSAREKLHHSSSADGNNDGGGTNNRQAHIMSDEVTRKMLQAVKRCLTFAQGRWPPEDLGQLMG